MIEESGLSGGESQPAQPRGKSPDISPGGGFIRSASQKGQTEVDGFSIAAKTLRFIVIGKPEISDALRHRGEKLGTVGIHIADEDSKLITVQMAGANLIVVAKDFQ